MNKLSNRFAVVGGLLASLLLASCGGAGGGATAAAPVDDTPQGAAFQFRDGLMHSISWKLGQLNGMAQGEIPVDEAAFKKHAADITTLAGMIPEGFIPNSIVKGSAALPEIWTNMSDFQQKAKDLETAAKSLSDAAAASGFESSKGMVAAVRQTCGGCHRPYRRREN